MIIHELQNYSPFCAVVMYGLLYQALLLNIEKLQYYRLLSIFFITLSYMQDIVCVVGVFSLKPNYCLLSMSYFYKQELMRTKTSFSKLSLNGDNNEIGL